MSTNYQSVASEYAERKTGPLLMMFCATAILFVGAPIAFAAVTVTTATGGSAISADTVGSAYTSLTGPVISEGVTADIGTGTITLNAPSGFEFDTGGTAPTVLVTRIAGSGNNNRNINDLASGSTIAVTGTASALTITITAATSNGVRNSLTWQNVRVRPSSGTPLASGNIVKTGASSISGVTDSVTNFGTLTEVVGAKNKLVITTQPSSSATVGTDFVVKPAVVLQDQFGNTVTTDSASTIARTAVLSTQACGGTAGSGVLSSTPASGAAVSSGVLSYTAMQYSAAESIKICFTSTGVTSALSNTVAVVAVATKFVIIQPASGTVGTPVTVTVQAQKSDNSIDTNYQSDVTLNTSGSATGAGLVDIVNGVGTKDISDTVAETVNLSLTDSQSTGLNVSSTQSLTFAAGAVSQYLLNDPGDMYARTRLGYTVTRKDSYGNVVGTATSTVYLYTSSTSSTKKFYDDSLAGSEITSIDIGPGHSTANVWYYDEEPGTYTITASDSTPTADGATGITDATDSVVVNPVAVKFVILDPTDGTVDAAITVTIQAQKPDNSVDTNYQSDITLVASGSATGAGLVDIINGVGIKNISDTLAETVGLSLSDSESTGLNVSSTQSVVFAGGVIAQFTLNSPGPLGVGERAGYTITRKDQYGNISSQGTSTIYLYSSSTSSNKRFYDAATAGSVITSVTIGDGQSTANAWYYDDLPGTWSITASDNASAPNGNVGINDAVDSLVVTAGPVATFLLNDPGDMTANTRLGYTVTRKDQFANLVTDGPTTVYLYSNSTGTSTPVFYDAATDGNAVTSITIANGQSSANVWYEDPNEGTWTVTASDNASAADGATGVADATDTVVVSAAPIVATRFTIVSPTDGTVDAPITITVRAEDGSGNLDTTYQSDVTLVTNGSATGAGLVSIVNGIGTKDISDTVAETVDLSLSDSQGTGLGVSSTETVVFAPGAVAQFALDNPGDEAAGTRIGYTVTRKDQYGNAVTAGATTVYLYSTSTGVNKKFYDAASGGSAISFIVITNGVSSVGFWQYDEKAGNWFVSVSDNATVPDGATGIADASDAIAVQPAATAKFLLNDPGNMTANTRLGYTVTRKDQFDNLVTTGVSLVYLYSSSTGTTTAFYSTATGGAPILDATINDSSSSGAFWYYDNTPGTWAVTASDNAAAPDGAGVTDAVDSVTVSAIPIVATRFVILPPATVQIGSSATVTIEAQDNSGNVDTTIQSGVTLVSTGSATGAGLVTMVNGVGTKTLQNTVAETIDLSLSDTQATGLDVSSTHTLTFSSTPVAPSTSGGSGGYSPPAPIIIGAQLTGQAFPKAKIQILSVSPLGSIVQGQTTASAAGYFSLLLKDISVGIGSYGIVGIDDLGRTTQTKVFNANYDNPNALLSVNSFLSPTLGLVHPTVRRNDVVGFVGSAMPGYTIGAEVDGVRGAGITVAAADGSYKILLPTGALALGSHTVRVRQVSPDETRSEYSPQKVFTVSSLFTPQTDFNQDGIINVQDWSIFLSRWSSTNKTTFLRNDLNGDGKVDVSDLSIFVRTLKK